MRRTIALALLAGLMLACAAPADAVPKPGERASIAVPVATLWKAPNVYRPIDRPAVSNPVDLDAWNRNLATGALRRALTGRVQTQALYGETVVVLRRSGAWAKVAVGDQPDPQDPRGYPGWLPVAQLGPPLPAGRTVVVTARTAELVVGGRVRARLSYGTRLPLVRWNGASAIVHTPDGEGRLTGVAQSVGPATGASIVREAKRFLGLRYLWGGLSAWGFDCSGLVWDVFRAHGMTVPRDADPQFRHGTPVAQSALRPGDLVFYGTQRYVHHVAIYAGGGRMVEAPNSDAAVRLVPFRTYEYAGARRYTSG